MMEITIMITTMIITTTIPITLMITVTTTTLMMMKMGKSKVIGCAATKLSSIVAP